MRAMTAIAVTAYFTASVLSVGAGLLQSSTVAHAVAVISAGQTTDQVLEAGESAESILLDDGTILTLAPGSRVRIERFDYNPQTGEGGLSLRLLNGGIKVTTGQAGRQNPIVVHTEGRSVEVQNATAAIVIDGGTLTATMLFGGQVKVLGTDPLTVFRPGFAAVIPKGGESGEIVRLGSQKVATLIEMFARPRGAGTQIASIASSQPGPGQPQRQQQRENRTRDDQQADGVDPRGPIFDKLIGGLASGLNLGLGGPTEYQSGTQSTVVPSEINNTEFLAPETNSVINVQIRRFLIPEINTNILDVKNIEQIKSSKVNESVIPSVFYGLLDSKGPRFDPNVVITPAISFVIDNRINRLSYTGIPGSADPKMSVNGIFVSNNIKLTDGFTSSDPDTRRFSRLSITDGFSLNHVLEPGPRAYVNQFNGVKNKEILLSLFKLDSPFSVDTNKVIDSIFVTSNFDPGEVRKFASSFSPISFITDSEKIKVSFGQKEGNNNSLGWVYTAGYSGRIQRSNDESVPVLSFTIDTVVPKKGQFLAFDLTRFGVEDGAERIFIYGGSAPVDPNVSHPLPGMESGTAIVYDVRDGLRLDSETSTALLGNGLRRGITFQVAAELDRGLVVMARPSGSTGVNNFIKIDSTLSLSPSGKITTEQASSISLATGSVGDSKTGLVGGMVGSTRASALGASTYLASGVFSQPVVQDRTYVTDVGGNQLGDPIHWFGGNSFTDEDGNTLENRIGYIVLGSNDPTIDFVETTDSEGNPISRVETVLQTAVERPIGDPNGTGIDNSTGNVDFEFLRLASRGVNSEFGGIHIDGEPPVKDLTVDTSVPTLNTTYKGFAAAHVEHVFDNLDDGTTLYAIESDVLTLKTEANDNRLKVTLPLTPIPLIVNPADSNLNSFAPKTVPTIVFGGFGVEQTQLSSYVNDNLFGARTNTSKEANAGIVSGAAIGVRTKDIPDHMAGIEICSSCKHVKWGFFFGDLNLQRGEDRRDHVHLGTWVAGKDPTTADRLDQGFTGTLTYSGHMIGNVFGPSSDGNSQLSYTARGDYTQTWDFNSNTNARKIKADFDGRTYNGTWDRSGNTSGFTGDFASGSLNGATPDLRNGSLRGGFFGLNAEEVGGRFSISADPRNPEIYDARGVFAARCVSKSCNAK